MATIAQNASINFLAPFAAVGRFMVSIMESNSRVQRVQFLNSLTDEELELRGIKREDIVQEVFKDVMYM